MTADFSRVWPKRFTILSDEGAPKIHRHHLLGTGKRVGVYLNHFVRSDAPDMFHDHPWRWGVALVLRGGYVEERRLREGSNRTRRWLGPLRLNVLRPGVFHRVELRDRRPAWTLFVHGPKVRKWGFLDAVTGAFQLWLPSDPRYL